MVEIPAGSVRIGAVAREIGLSVSRARQLADDGTLPSVVSEGGHRYFDLDDVRKAWGAHRGISALPALAGRILDARTVPLAGLAEDEVWRDVRAAAPVDEDRRQVVAYAFTEMLNNAIDHSAGRCADITVATTPGGVLIVDIADDGRGVFAHLREARHLPDLTASIAELTKGKITTAEKGHSGEGIFFTSKAVDLFRLSSDGLAWTVDNRRKDSAVGQSPVVRGTEVHLEIDPGPRRSLADVFGAYTDGDAGFDRSRPIVKLFGLGLDFVSRSEAKRLAVGLERFSRVEIDFTGVDGVGQAFVDELFRVWAVDHPETVLEPSNMNAAVEFMVKRGLPRST